MATQFIFDFTLDQLKEIVPKNPYINDWYNALVAILPEYDIETELRVAAFLAQCAHESGNFRFIKENLNYRWQSLRRVFPKYFPNDQIAQQYASMPNKQEAIANRIYANRMGNGPEESGDGFRYCGRGLIQLTGKTNYTNYAMSLEIDVDEAVEHLKTFEGCVQSAAWFWDENNLNRFADKKDIVTLSKRINGGTIGLEDRIKHYNHALHVLGVH
jgi:putative chitinase